MFLHKPIVFISIALLANIFLGSTHARIVPEISVLDDSTFGTSHTYFPKGALQRTNRQPDDRDLDFDFFARSENAPSKDPTHQHPQVIPSDVISVAHAAHDADLEGHSGLARRDATKCLADGTCADKRCVI
jgi:hypothetical protein